MPSCGQPAFHAWVSRRAPPQSRTARRPVRDVPGGHVVTTLAVKPPLHRFVTA